MVILLRSITNQQCMGSNPATVFIFYKLIECPDKFRSARKCQIPLGISWIRLELVILVRIWLENLALLQPFEVKKILTRF